MALSQPSHSTTSRSELPQPSADHFVTLQERPSTIYKQSSTVRTAPSTADTAIAGASSNDTLNRQGNNYKHRQYTLSISSLKQNRTRLFTLAALARDKITNAITNLSESSIRSRPSSSSVHRSVQSSPTSPLHNSKSLRNWQTHRQAVKTKPIHRIPIIQRLPLFRMREPREQI
jgi:hypothetical protein